jgi:hypothetical protein
MWWWLGGAGIRCFVDAIIDHADSKFENERERERRKEMKAIENIRGAPIKWYNR